MAGGGGAVVEVRAAVEREEYAPGEAVGGFVVLTASAPSPSAPSPKKCADGFFVQVVGRVTCVDRARLSPVDVERWRAAREEAAAGRSEEATRPGSGPGGAAEAAEEEGEKEEERVEKGGEEEEEEEDDGDMDRLDIFVSRAESASFPAGFAFPDQAVFRFRAPLPASLPPTHSGAVVRFHYSAVVTAVHKGCRVAEIKVPFRVLVPSAYDARGGHALPLPRKARPPLLLRPVPGSAWVEDAWGRPPPQGRSVLSGVHPSPAVFNISKTQPAAVAAGAPRNDPVVRITVARRVFAPGDMVRAHLDFSVGVLPCARLVVTLERLERVLVGPSAGGPPSRTVLWDTHEYCANTSSTSVLFAIPAHLPPAFRTDLVEVTFALRFKFVIRSTPPPEAFPSPQEVAAAAAAASQESGEEEAQEQEKNEAEPAPAPEEGMLSRLLSPLTRLVSPGSPPASSAADGSPAPPPPRPSADRLRGTAPDPFPRPSDIEELRWELPVRVVPPDEPFLADAQAVADVPTEADELARVEAPLGWRTAVVVAAAVKK